MSRVFDNQPDLSNQKILLKSRNNPTILNNNECAIFYDSLDNSLKFITDTNIFTFAPTIQPSLIANNNITLTQNDSGKIIFLNTITGVDITLPSINSVIIGTKYKIIVRVPPINPNLHRILLGGGDANIFEGGFYGSTIADGNDYQIASTSSTISFTNTSDIGSFVEIISDGDNWLINGFVPIHTGSAIA
jgi:hypothetical protein